MEILTRQEKAMKRLLALLALPLSACAAPSGYWMNSANDPSSFERDKAQCIYESKMATAGVPSTFSLSQNVAQDIATGVQQGEMQTLCLKAKGYYWVTK
jgi:hypothetical protein